MKKRSKKGFTLIELIIVIAILAILALIAIPAYSKYRENAQIEADNATAKVIYDAILVADASSDPDDVASEYCNITGYDDQDPGTTVVYGVGQFPLS